MTRRIVNDDSEMSEDERANTFPHLAGRTRTPAPEPEGGGARAAPSRRGGGRGRLRPRPRTAANMAADAPGAGEPSAARTPDETIIS